MYWNQCSAVSNCFSRDLAATRVRIFQRSTQHKKKDHTMYAKPAINKIST